MAKRQTLLTSFFASSSASRQQLTIDKETKVIVESSNDQSQSIMETLNEPELPSRHVDLTLNRSIDSSIDSLPFLFTSNPEIWNEVSCNFQTNPISTPSDLIATLYYNYGKTNPAKEFHPIELELFLLETQRADIVETFQQLITKLILSAPQILPPHIPLLTRNSTLEALTLSKRQAACLIACAFMGVLYAEAEWKRWRRRNIPGLSFHNLFCSATNGRRRVRQEKFKSLINYFRRVTLNDFKPNELLVFNRMRLDRVVKWNECEVECSAELEVDECKLIEDQQDCLQVDFANRMVGGGVLGNGAVQEEIRFLISPELLCSMLITERLADDESLLMVGSERYMRYCGYAQTFQFSGDYIDLNPHGDAVVAIDALQFQSSNSLLEQLDRDAVERELNKALIGFSRSPYLQQSQNSHYSRIATGNWGCGAFGGNVQLKALIQLMAASVVQRPVLYLTFGHAELSKCQFETLWGVLKQKRIKIGQLFQLIESYKKEIVEPAVRNASSYFNCFLFDFILSKLTLQ